MFVFFVNKILWGKTQVWKESFYPSWECFYTFFYSSILRVVSALEILLEIEEQLTYAHACLSYSAVMWPMNFVEL